MYSICESSIERTIFAIKFYLNFLSIISVFLIFPVIKLIIPFSFFFSSNTSGVNNSSLAIILILLGIETIFSSGNLCKSF